MAGRKDSRGSALTDVGKLTTECLILLRFGEPVTCRVLASSCVEPDLLVFDRDGLAEVRLPELNRLVGIDVVPHRVCLVAPMLVVVAAIADLPHGRACISDRARQRPPED